VSGPALTVDVVALAGPEPLSVLLIQRRNEPFRGCWALPGGFVEEGERVEAAARRELREETGIATDAQLPLLGVYDTPGRDPRGWTISIVRVLRSDRELPARGGDDAGDARWFALEDLPPLAFDHALVIADAVRASSAPPVP
jgi:8-oxo-dGTP diphosphatase